MSSTIPTIFASDFDGVICDGLKEYFATTKKTYELIWNQDRDLTDLEASFSKLRPVIETGWEMPILLRALVLGVDEAEILANWQAIAQNIIKAEKLEKQAVVQELDGVRDNWIANDLDNWLQLHCFYPGVIDFLNQVINSPTQLYIVTTKGGRFAQQLLQQQGIELPSDRIIGKESKRPKYETLRLLRETSDGNNFSIWFVEDRIKALQQVQQQPDLDYVKLFLADWGYNLKSERNLAQNDPQMELLSLEKLGQNFTNW